MEDNKSVAEKDLRDKQVLDLHNGGNSIRDIKKITGLGVATIHRILGSLIQAGNAPSKSSTEIVLTGNEEVFKSFVGYERTDVNEYVHKDTGEVVRVVFVKAKGSEEFGKFVIVK